VRRADSQNTWRKKEKEMNVKKESSSMDFVTTMQVARLHLEHSRETARANSYESLFVERSLASSRQGSPVKLIASLVVFLLTVAALFTATKAQDIPQVLFVAGETLTGPKTIEAGYVRFALENKTQQDRAHGIYRVKEGVDLEAAKQVIIDEFSGKLTRNEVVKAYQTYLTGFYGGAVFLSPGETKEVLVTLEPGTYVVYADYISEQGLPLVEPEQVTLLEVAASNKSVEKLTPDYVVKMVDHAFALPPVIEAGRHLWSVENLGHQEHLMFIYELVPGKTLQDVLAFLQGQRESPLVNGNKALGVHALSYGLNNDVWLELAAGNYAVICFITDPETGLPHAVLGMTQTFTVTEKGL
jgi:hypothetical protein